MQIDEDFQKAYRRTGLAAMGITIDDAMESEPIRKALICSAHARRIRDARNAQRAERFAALMNRMKLA